MEIDITSLLNMDAFELSHSRMEGGDNAGQNTWRNALEQAEETPILNTEEKLQAMRDFALSSGGWDEEKVAAWTSEEVNALFLQWVAGDVREMPSKENAYGEDDSRYSNADSLEDIDWVKAEEWQAEGQISSNLFQGVDGKIYFGLYA